MFQKQQYSSRNSSSLADDKVLEVDEFSTLYKGTGKKLPLVARVTSVSVKVITDFSKADNKQRFVTELKVMTIIGRNVNVIGLLAICLEYGKEFL